MYMFSNKYPNLGWWTEKGIDNYGLTNIYIYMLSNGYPNPGWWTEIRIHNYVINVYVFKQVSESGLAVRNKNTKLWFAKCIFVQTSNRIQAGVSEAGLVERNKNRQIWFANCICSRTSIRIQACGPK